MRWSCCCFAILFFLRFSFAQVTIQGTVQSSVDDAIPIGNANVQIFKLEVTGSDTLRSLAATALTDLQGRFSTQIATGVNRSEPALPVQFELSESYPNPFSGTTQMGLSVPHQDRFSIAIYNILGQRLAGTVQVLPSGSYSIRWNGADIPGVYFAVIRTGNQSRIVKMVQLTRSPIVAPLQILRGAPIGIVAARTQSALSTGLLQITVSKPTYHTYTTPVLPFATQTLSIPLTYAGTGTISRAERESALTQTGAQFVQFLNSRPKLEAAQAMAEWLKTRPEFEAAGSQPDGNAWGRFKDGRLIIFVNNRSTGGVSGKYSMVPATRQAAPELLKDPSNIPGSSKAEVYDALGSVFLNIGESVNNQLYNANYDAFAKAHDGTVSQLKAVNNVGVFFHTGHGGTGYLDNGSTEFAVWTANTVSAYADSVFEDELKEHRLVYMDALYDTLNGKDNIECHYAFTQLFVRKYMSFATNSLVYLDACSSAGNNVFVNAFLAKGASVYAGWSSPSNAGEGKTAATAFFSRTLGTEDEVSDKEDPPQRPFDWQKVWSWMQSKHYDYGDATGGSRLLFVSQSGSDNTGGPLAPSIASMFVHPYDEKLYLYGLFGDNPGSDGVITVGSMPMEVYEWGYDSQSGMDKIVCKIPDDGAGSYGDVQVTVRKIKSNKTQLSRYKGDFTLIHETTDGRKFEVKLTLQFRVHLLGFRTKPGEKPIFNQNTYVVHADMASTGESTASGSTGGAVAWSGHVTDLHNNIDGAESPKSFIAGAWFDPEQRTMKLYLSGIVQNGIMQSIGTQVIPMNIIFGIDEFDGKKENFPSYAEIPLNADFSISKSSAQAKKVGAYFSMLVPMADKVRIEWGDIKCDVPPDPRAPR